MLPAILVDFLDRASVAIGATRDAARVPHLHWVSGWEMAADRETLTCLIARGFTRELVESLADNGEFAVTLEVIGPHETYQFKGSEAESRKAEPRDWAVFGRCTERYASAVHRVHGDMYPLAVLRAHPREPELAVRFRVREVFVQTPGPAAGLRVFPRLDP